MKLSEISPEDVVTKGRMNKAPWDMTAAEREVWYKLNQIKAQHYLFSIGQPLVYQKDNKMIAEYADGTIELID